VHDDPDEEKLNDYRQLLATNGIKVSDLSRREKFVRLLGLLRRSSAGLLSAHAVLRSMRKGCYRAKPDGHYGLAKNDYTHFTSPIRRYSDLVVHRVSSTPREIEHTTARALPPEAIYIAGVDGARRTSQFTEINSTEAERDS